MNILFCVIKNLIVHHVLSPLDTCKVKLPRSTKLRGKNRLICVKGAQINIAQNVTLFSRSWGYHGGMPFGTTLLADVKEAKISIGAGCGINGAYIHAKKNIVIGNNCVIAAGSNILDSNGHELLSGNRTESIDSPKDIIIGNNVWICLNSVILKGTEIGNNCVIAANSVVKGNFPDNSLIQGNPAKIISQIPIKVQP